jgi:L-Ala-D/L-Glu epimerase
MPLKLRVGSAPIPFRASFGHAAAVRNCAENVIVAVTDPDGATGLGEGCPRSYVTGEDVASSRAFIDAHRSELEHVEDLSALRLWVKARERLIDQHPSAFCAVELALLDLFARRQGKSVEVLLGVAPSPHTIKATAIYGTGGGLKFGAQGMLFRAIGMSEAKLKLSGDAVSNVARAAALARHGRVRLDANNLWGSAPEAIPALKQLAACSWAVEEPIAARDWDGLLSVAGATGLRIILDESMLGRADFEAAPAALCAIPNLRVSKLGGLLRSLECVADAGEDIIVGAQVGETSILARAGLVLANAAGPRLRGYEGAYAPFLLVEDAVTPSLGFGRRGAVRDARFEHAAGWGLELRPGVVAWT